MEDISTNSDFFNLEIPSPIQEFQGLRQNLHMEFANETSPRNNEIIRNEGVDYRIINRDVNVDTVFRDSPIPREVFENERVKRFFCYEKIPDSNSMSMFSFRQRNDPDNVNSPFLSMDISYIIHIDDPYEMYGY